MEFTWEYLATVVGAGAVTTLVVQMVKSIMGKDLSVWWLRLVVYVVGSLVLLAGTYFTIGVSVQSALLCLLNGVAVYFAATGEYHTVLKPIVEAVNKNKV